MLTTSKQFRTGTMILPLVIAVLVFGCDNSTTDESASRPVAPTPSPVPLPPPISALPNWKVDPALLDQLEPYRDIEGFQIRLPKEWQTKPVPGSVPFSKTLAMEGPARDDGTKIAFMITVTTYPPGSPDTAFTAERELNSIIDGFNKSIGLVDMQQDTVESGQIDSVPFVRVRWQGTAANGLVKGHGFHYLTKDTKTGVWVVFFDTEPHHKESLKLGTAAVMTLRKK